jgi:hypothetical protein
MIVKSFPQWEWTLISTNVTAVTLNNLTPGFDFYYTTRPTGDTAPDALVATRKPADAIKVFRIQSTDKNSTNKPDEFVLEAQIPFDLYVYCFNRDNTIQDDGSLLVRDGVGNSLPVNARGGLDTNAQDQFTQTIIEKFNQVTNSTTLTALAVLYEYTVTVASTTGIIVGSHIIIFSPDLVRFTSFDVLAINGSILTLDSPIDAAYPIGSFVDISFTDMSVNGAVTPQVFGVRGLGIVPGIDLTVDFTRIIMTCFTASAVSLAKFGDLAKLLRGLVLRNRNGETFNIFNVKDNGEIAGIALDWIPYTTINPQQGQHGFTVRLTFTKLGVVQRLAMGQDLEIIVQDDLTGLTSLEIFAEGHVVD